MTYSFQHLTEYLVIFAEGCAEYDTCYASQPMSNMCIL